jgi:hypothetical protein
MANEFINLIGNPYRPWLDTALCCKADFFHHQLTQRILCGDCYLELPGHDVFYEHISRHYINIGTEDQFEYCQTCNAEITLSRAAAVCVKCDNELTAFVQHIYTTDKTPHLSSEPTVIMLREIVTCDNREK